MNLKEINFPVELESKTLILRKLNKDDKNDIFEIYSDEETALYDDWNPMKDISRAERLINNSVKYFEEKSALRYGLIDSKVNKLVGICCLCDFDETNNKCMIYYQINRHEWNKGYASEAIGQIVKYAFEELKVNRIEAYVTPGNDASVRVLEKNGFINEGLLREMEYYKNEFQDGIIMGMIRKDWANVKKNQYSK